MRHKDLKVPRHLPNRVNTFEKKTGKKYEMMFCLTKNKMEREIERRKSWFVA